MPFDYTINCISEHIPQVHMVTSNQQLGPNKTDCNIISYSSKVTLNMLPLGSSPSLSNPHTYSVIDQLWKTLTHISILELLRLTPSHKEILDKALVETIVPTNLAQEKFQAMVGNLTSSSTISFTK